MQQIICDIYVLIETNVQSNTKRMLTCCYALQSNYITSILYSEVHCGADSILVSSPLWNTVRLRSVSVDVDKDQYMLT